MKHLPGKIAFGVLVISASFFTTGCNQSTETTSPTSANGNAAKPTMDNSVPVESLKYTDISAQEAETAKPLNLMGGGPMAHVDTGMLSALKRSYIERGTKLMASQLELSYDFKTGDYKGNTLLLSPKSIGLEKSATTAAWDGIFTYQGYSYTKWLPTKASNGEWLGDPNSKSGWQLLDGFYISTKVVNGVTPSIYWNIYWGYGGESNGTYGWTGTYSWNNSGYSETWPWQGFVANTRTPGYDICYEMKFSAHNTGADLYGCNGGHISAGGDMRLGAMRFIIITKYPTI